MIVGSPKVGDTGALGFVKNSLFFAVVRYKIWLSGQGFLAMRNRRPMEDVQHGQAKSGDF